MTRRKAVFFVAIGALAAWLALPPHVQAQLIPGRIYARQIIQPFTSLILGSADTSGVRLEVNSGTGDVREGDDSAYGSWRARNFIAQLDGLGTTSTDGDRLANSTAAAAGAQQYSPRTCWEGQGWKTDATAASQSVVFCAETQPVQGSSAPTGNFILKASINGGAFSTVGTFTSAGAFTSVSDITSGAGLFASQDIQTSGGNVLTAAGGAFIFTGRTRLTSSADGALRVRNDGGTNTYDITLADWGTTLSPEGVSVANDAAVSLGTGAGMMTFTVDCTAGASCLGGANSTVVCGYTVRGTVGAASAEIFDSGTGCTVTKDNAGTYNIYWDTDQYYFQNKSGASVTMRAIRNGR